MSLVKRHGKEVPDMPRIGEEPEVKIGYPEMDANAPNRTEAQEQVLEDFIRNQNAKDTRFLFDESRFDAPNTVMKSLTVEADCTGWDVCSCGNMDRLIECKPDCRRCHCRYHQRVKFFWEHKDNITASLAAGWFKVPREWIRHRVFSEYDGMYQQKDTFLLAETMERFQARKKAEMQENAYKYDEKLKKQRRKELLEKMYGEGEELQTPMSSMVERTLRSSEDARGSLPSMKDALKKEMGSN